MESVYYHCINHPTNETIYDACLNNKEDLKQIINRNYKTVVITCDCVFTDILNELQTEFITLEKHNVNNNEWLDFTNNCYANDYGCFFVNEDKLFKIEWFDSGKKSKNEINIENFLKNVKQGSVILYKFNYLKYLTKILEGSSFVLKIQKISILHGLRACLCIIDQQYPNTKSAIK
jgi:hypothetical protein